MKIGIITAMSAEQKQVEQLLDNKKEYAEGPFLYTEGTIQNNTIILMKCGIGKVNAAAGTVELIRNFHPDCIISTGVAGGIDNCLKVMDVVASRQIVYHDVWCGEGNAYGQIQGLPALFEGNETLFNCAMSLDTETAIHGGLICSGDKFITDRQELNTIKSAFPEGLAVDMESGAIAQICYIYKVPFISFRIISDTPGADNHWEQYTIHYQQTYNKNRNMKTIPSFTIDHIRLLRGIYVSRKDQVGGDTVTTFDIRMKEPNREPALGQGALHTIEHLAATFLRNHPVWGDKIVYWGPMGCLTGNYLLMKGDLESKDIVELMQETFRFVAEFEGEVPGTAPKDCGNCLLHDLPMAKWESARYLHEVLEKMTDENLHYPL